jgi:hypothetical protein
MQRALGGWRRWAGALFLAALVATACGDGDGEQAESPSGPRFACLDFVARVTSGPNTGRAWTGDLVLTPDSTGAFTGLLVPPGVADPRDLITIVGNLIDNAIDAAAEGPAPRWVRIGARVSIASNGQEPSLELSVADSGPGLDPENVPNAFHRGWTTKSSDRLHGRGLGLGLVAQAVHRYGGSIDVTNDRGAVFTVRLPLDKRDRPGRSGAPVADDVAHDAADGAGPVSRVGAQVH